MVFNSVQWYKQGASFKTPYFAQSLRQAQILILEIRHVFLWLKISPSLTLSKIEHFETDSNNFTLNPEP